MIVLFGLSTISLGPAAYLLPPTTDSHALISAYTEVFMCLLCALHPVSFITLLCTQRSQSHTTFSGSQVYIEKQRFYSQQKIEEGLV